MTPAFDTDIEDAVTALQACIDDINEIIGYAQIIIDETRNAANATAGSAEANTAAAAAADAYSVAGADNDLLDYQGILAGVDITTDADYIDGKTLADTADTELNTSAAASNAAAVTVENNANNFSFATAQTASNIHRENTRYAQLVFDVLAYRPDPLEAAGFPNPVMMFNMASGNVNEKLHQIRIWFKGEDFSPSDLAPLSEDAFKSGVSLWQDNKNPNGGAAVQVGLFDPRYGVNNLQVGDLRSL